MGMLILDGESWFYGCLAPTMGGWWLGPGEVVEGVCGRG